MGSCLIFGIWVKWFAIMSMAQGNSQYRDGLCAEKKDLFVCIGPDKV